MTIWYISPTGSDTTGDGTSGNPYLTVNKCITVGVNGDTIKALNGTYTISSTINITKQFTITSDSGVNADVIFDANTTIFNIQESNVNITYITMQTSNTLPLITIDRMSTGSIVPTFWTGIIINNCNIKYIQYALTLNGSFTVNSNTFTRQSGTSIVDIIRVYSTRGSCSISSNTFTDAKSVRYVIYLTSIGSGTYLDRCNSKGGTLTINNNNITFTYNAQSHIFIYQNYFNAYIYGTVGQNTQYNSDTKLTLTCSTNTISYIMNGKFIDLLISSSTNLNMFNLCTINNNTINNTNLGIVHLSKQTSPAGTIVIDSNDLNRNVFKIYNNTLITPSLSILFQFDISDTTTIFTDVAGTIPAVNINDPVRLLKSTTKGLPITTTLVNAPALIMDYSTTGKKMLKFNGTSNYSFYDTSIFSGVNNATLIIVSNTPSNIGDSGHLFNMGYGWYPNSTSIMETFYTAEDIYGRRRYPYTANSFSNTLIYAVIADSTTNLTKCYTLNLTTSLLNNMATLPYTASFATAPYNGRFSIGINQIDQPNRAGLAEIIVFSSALSESILLQEMLKLKTKWNI